MLLVFNRDLGVLLDRGGRHDVQMQRALFDAMFHLGVGFTTTSHESGVVTVGPGVYAHLGAVARQTVKENERSRTLGVLSALRVLRSVLRTEHILAAQFDHWSIRRKIHGRH